MPFLRVLRDKRGYETTYLMHWFREGARLRSSILYVFRTPPAVGVGQRPLESAVRREIEQSHPDIDFDWKGLRETQRVVDATPEPRGPRGRRRGADGPIVDAPRMAPEPASKAPAPAAPRLSVPSTIEGATAEEQLVFLRSWYEPIRDQVSLRVTDPSRREALYALAERLNPEPWSGDQAIADGLCGAREALSRLSSFLTKRRRRSRRSRPATAPGPTQEVASEPTNGG